MTDLFHQFCVIKVGSLGSCLRIPLDPKTQQPLKAMLGRPIAIQVSLSHHYSLDVTSLRFLHLVAFDWLIPDI